MNYTINEIPDEAVELSGNEMIPIWQGETKKVSVATLAGYVQDADSYSTTETLTGGKWIDGKPIYRKSVILWKDQNTLGDGITRSGSNYGGEAVPANIDVIVDCYVTSKRPGGEVDIFKSQGNNGGTGAFVPNTTNRTAYFGTNYSTNPAYAYAVYNYTKTTDS